jgi:hypothetical protein
MDNLSLPPDESLVLRQDPNNLNRGTPRGPSLIAANVAANGVGRPIVAAADGTIIAGNQADKGFKLALGDGVEPIIVRTDGTRPVVHVRTDIPSMDDPRAIGLAAGDNLLPDHTRNIDREAAAALIEEWEIDPESVGVIEEVEDELEEIEDQDELEPPAPTAPAPAPAPLPPDGRAVATGGEPVEDAERAEPKDAGQLKRLFQVVVSATDERDQKRIYNLLREMGLEVRLQSL